ncbi:hypothetical protein FHY55_11690 [Oceanicola sp. D3]|uniref:hypothetical protein n=1 Tax=Oceanicola sp. D3 TaxID=2587163 RepID=UPI00111F4B0D|nr:hypothetical protein [Oceanicola sp. D3]QDC09868.1 hypothetical protein FHY55_11690 [Oceanicola sp. D3]
MNKVISALAAGLMALGSAAQAADPVDTAAYDLLFKQGTLDGFEKGDVLDYRREVSNTLVPAAAARDTGEIELTLEGGTPPVARLEFRQDEKHRSLGNFPASVGNPVIMYFVETVVRDMAESAGGSPFYIRNRVKEALVRPADITEAEDGTVTVVMHPFEDDPNVARMQGFGDLALTVEMSTEVPGWYSSLSAEAGEVYRSTVVFEGVAE